MRVGMYRDVTNEEMSSPSGGPWPVSKPASSHAYLASKDTHARASADHHAMATMPHPKRRHPQTNKQSINACNEHGKASTARRAGGHVDVNPPRVLVL
jgi:uncharacterized protein involved in copper resistance